MANITISGSQLSSPLDITYAELISRVYETMKDDESNPVYPLDLVKQYLNEAEQVTLSKSKLEMMEATYTLTATTSGGVQEFSLPYNFDEIISVKVGGVRYGECENEFFDGDSSGRFSTFQNKLQLPSDAEGQVVIKYYVKGGTMREDTDQPIIPAEYSRLLVEYASEKLFLWNRMDDRADRRRAEYVVLRRAFRRAYSTNNGSVLRRFRPITR